jgi:hypothetical protein
MAFTQVISGVRTQDNGVLAANQRPDIDTTLKVLEPYQTPFLQFLFFSNKQSKPVVNKQGKFTWFEDEYQPYQSTVKAAVTASTTLTLTSSNFTDLTIFKLYDTVYMEDTDEMGYITTASTTVVITAMDGTTSLTSLATVGSYIKIIGSSNIENNSTPTFLSTQEVEKYSYCQIFEEGVGNTGRDQAGEAYTDGKTHAELVQKKMKEMKFQYERAFIYNLTAGTQGTGGSKRTWTIGLLGRLTTNKSGYDTLDETFWDNYFVNVFAKGTGKKAHYCGSNQYQAIQNIIKNKLGVMPNSFVTKYGVRVVEYEHGMGTIKIVWDPVLDGKFVNWGITIDEGNVKGRHMGNDDKGSRKFRIEANVQTPGTDRKETKLLADIGVQIEQEETMGILYKKAS